VAVSPEERKEANEAVFRVANDDIQRRARELELVEDRVPFLCECSEEDCHAIVLLSSEEYERVRSLKRHFFLTPGHQGDHERVVARYDRYWLVSKET